jgi:hypothetical protein
MPDFYNNWARPADTIVDPTMWSGAAGVADPLAYMPYGNQSVAPKVPSLASGGGLKLGANMDTANLALTGIGTLGNLWAAFQAARLAKKQFEFTKGVTNTNLNNQIATYNTGLQDRARNRAIMESRTPEETQAYVTSNSLRRYG